MRVAASGAPGGFADEDGRLIASVHDSLDIVDMV